MVLTQLGIPTGPANPAIISDSSFSGQVLLFFNTTTASLHVCVNGEWVDTAPAAPADPTATWISSEIPTGAANGTNKAFVLANNVKAGTAMVFVDGALLPKAGYSITAKNLAIVGAAPVTSVLVTYFTA